MRLSAYRFGGPVTLDVSSQGEKMKLRQATSEDAEAISALITRLSEKYITPTCLDSARENLLSSMSVKSILDYMKSGYEYDVFDTGSDGIVAVIEMKDNPHLLSLVCSRHVSR